MIALLQRVRHAAVSVDGVERTRIGAGVLALIGVEREDTEADALRLAERVAGFRLFADADGKMNLDLAAAGGELLLVPQFTLAADTSRGRRASFASAAAPERARALFGHLDDALAARLPRVERGVFGADMQVALVNDGPVTFSLRCGPGGHGRERMRNG